MEINTVYSVSHTNTPFTFAGLSLHELFGPKYFANFLSRFLNFKHSWQCFLRCSSMFWPSRSVPIVPLPEGSNVFGRDGIETNGIDHLPFFHITVSPFPISSMASFVIFEKTPIMQFVFWLLTAAGKANKQGSVKILRC